MANVSPRSLESLDDQMAKLDGRQGTQQLQQRGLDIPIVLMSAQPEMRQTANEIQAQAYLAKPFTFTQLWVLTEPLRVAVATA
jgi:CheY-like chemotaxis protein